MSYLVNGVELGAAARPGSTVGLTKGTTATTSTTGTTQAADAQTASPDVINAVAAKLTKLGMLPSPGQSFWQVLNNFRIMYGLPVLAEGLVSKADSAALAQAIASFPPPGSTDANIKKEEAAASGMPSWLLPAGIAVAFLLLRKG